MLLPAALIVLMRAQHGLITRRQCLEHGVSAAALDAMVHRGALERVLRGVYRWPGSATPPEQALMAAVLRCGDGTRVAGWAAGALHGLEGCSFEDSYVVLLEPGHRITGVPFGVCEGQEVLPGDRATVRGVPTVSVARLLIGLAAPTITKKWRVAYDSGRRLGHLSPSWLERRAEANAGVPGAAAVLEFLEGPDAAPESEGERALGGLLSHAAAPPEWGVELLPGIRVDALYRAARLVLEYDGRDHHTLDTDIAADLARQRRLEAEGWLVLRITWRMVRDEPVETIARIERLRREREAALAR